MGDRGGTVGPALTGHGTPKSRDYLLEAKARLGLHRSRTVDLARVPSLLATAAHGEVADDISNRSITDAAVTRSMHDGRLLRCESQISLRRRERPGRGMWVGFQQ